MNSIRVYQDGNVFYNDNTGDVIFESSVVVKDFDLKAAELAREEFLLWADGIGLKYELI
jgi:hypothetical protein